MLNINRISRVASSYSPQELIAALVWQRQFNYFNGEEIITDLSEQPNLWRSFLFSGVVYAPKDQEIFSFACMISTLLAMANYRPVPEDSVSRLVAYPADTLYILTENREPTVTQLIDLGKKWQADTVEVVDGKNDEYGSYLQLRLRESLIDRNKSLLDPSNRKDKDAAIVVYWWD